MKPGDHGRPKIIDLRFFYSALEARQPNLVKFRAIDKYVEFIETLTILIEESTLKKYPANRKSDRKHSSTSFRRSFSRERGIKCFDLWANSKLRATSRQSPSRLKWASLSFRCWFCCYHYTSYRCWVNRRRTASGNQCWSLATLFWEDCFRCTRRAAPLAGQASTIEACNDSRRCCLPWIRSTKTRRYFQVSRWAYTSLTPVAEIRTRSTKVCILFEHLCLIWISACLSARTNPCPGWRRRPALGRSSALSEVPIAPCRYKWQICWGCFTFHRSRLLLPLRRLAIRPGNFELSLLQIALIVPSKIVSFFL